MKEALGPVLDVGSWGWQCNTCTIPEHDGFVHNDCGRLTAPMTVIVSSTVCRLGETAPTHFLLDLYKQAGSRERWRRTRIGRQTTGSVGKVFGHQIGHVLVGRRAVVVSAISLGAEARWPCPLGILSNPPPPVADRPSVEIRRGRCVLVHRIYVPSASAACPLAAANTKTSVVGVT